MSTALPFATRFALDIKRAEQKRREALARCASPDLATVAAVDAAFEADMDVARERLFNPRSNNDRQ